MAKVWILDSETKGTGAHVAPLARQREGGAPREQLSLAHLRRPPRRPRPAPAPEPRRFKVVDVLANRVLAEDVRAPQAIEALAAMRSALDVCVYIRRSPGGRWRLLSRADTRALWELRGHRGTPREPVG